MFPIRDVNPGLRRPWLTWVIIAVAAYVFFALQPQDTAGAGRFAYRYAAIPCELITGQPLSEAELQQGSCSSDRAANPVFPEKLVPASILTSLFLHAGLLHLLGNMWSLWIFGNNIEEAYSRWGYLLLYLAAGVVATLAFVMVRPESTTPLVGASGAIAGIMGSYLVLFPGASVVTVIPIFILPWVVAIPAWVFLVIWFVGQFFIAGASPAIAWEAHVAGFLFGAVLTLLLSPLLRRRIRAHRRAAYAMR